VWEGKKPSVSKEINGDDHGVIATCTLPAPDRKIRCESVRARRLAPAKNIQEDRLTAPPPRPALLPVLVVPAGAGGGMPRIVETPIVAADRNSNPHTMMMLSERLR
jgi:hypothetical protein